MFGTIEVITGCVKSGKTRELDCLLERYSLAGRKVRRVRFCAAREDVDSRPREVAAEVVNSLRDAELMAAGAEVFGMDDAHWAPAGIENIVMELSHRGVAVLVAGRDEDEEGAPIPSVAWSVGAADRVKKLSAVCVSCRGLRATRTVRGAAGETEPWCGSCRARERASVDVAGRVSVLAGCMFSGKTSELIRHLRRREIGGKRVALFRAVTDSRSTSDIVVTHDGAWSHGCVSVRDSKGVIAYVRREKPDVIGIDEAQFLAEGAVDDVRWMSEQGIEVVVAMLDQDSFESVWENSMGLFCVADEVRKLEAVCAVCGEDARKTYRKVESRERILVGGAAEYEARCHRCLHH